MHLPMRKFLLVAAVTLATAGCGILYKQPIYQGNLMETEAVGQLKPGMSKQQVGQVAAEIRAYRKPEPYKGKGVRYADEVIVLKETKKK